MSAINVRNDQEVRRRTSGVTNAETRVNRRTGEGLITSYAHHNGKIGVLVEVNCETDFVARTSEFRTLARYLAEQIAATAPVAVDRDQMPADLVARKRQSFESQVRALGKPEQLAAKIVDGKMEAYFRVVVLMDQEWVREPKITIADLVKDVSTKTGETIRVRRFARFHMGIA
ncbi:MAG TPA: elongation factor Ts [Gemmatimonadaceae bacterium]|nr:elongation factor Ts [Gemmatimonadaceae bacterium]